MKKVLLACDRTHFSETAFGFARKMNEQEPILLTVAFLPEVVIPTIRGFASTLGDPLLIPAIDEDDTVVESNIKRFETLCQRNDIEYRIHKEFGDFAIPELKKETLFADLLIIGSEAFYDQPDQNHLQDSLKDAMHVSKCPVVVVPEKCQYPQTNILAYDGSDSSVFAIKQFSYLFPGLRNNKTVLIYMNDEKGYDVPFEQYVEELVAPYFPDLTIARLHIKTDDSFNKWLDNYKQPILISGAFGRSAISQLFKKSFVYQVVCEHKIPVFIAHPQ